MASSPSNTVIEQLEKTKLICVLQQEVLFLISKIYIALTSE